MALAMETLKRESMTPNGILELLRLQAKLHAKLESFADRQRALVTGSDVGPLLSLLADRQKLTDQLVRVGDGLAPVRRDWAAVRERFTPDERAEAEQLLAETQERLKRMIEGDESDARLLSARKQSVARALRATHTTSQAVSAYRSPAGSASRLDCVDEGVS